MCVSCLLCASFSDLYFLWIFIGIQSKSIGKGYNSDFGTKMPKSHRSETYPESEKQFADVDVLLEQIGTV